MAIRELIRAKSDRGNARLLRQSYRLLRPKRCSTSGPAHFERLTVSRSGHEFLWIHLDLPRFGMFGPITQRLT
jgi:hypothetical protein